MRRLCSPGAAAPGGVDPERQPRANARGVTSLTAGTTTVAPTPEKAGGHRPPHLISVLVLLVGLGATAALVLVATVNYDHNENRLLELRVKDAGALIAESIPTIQTPLASAAELAAATQDPAEFVGFMEPYVHAGGAVSASLWGYDDGKARLLAVAGAAPHLAAGSAVTLGLLGAAQRSDKLCVSKIEGPEVVHLAFAYSPPGLSEVAVEEDRVEKQRASIASSSAFANLEYAIYLGRNATPNDLLTTDAPQLPFAGRHASIVVPFGNSAFVLAISPTVSLQGTFSRFLGLVVGIIGVLVSLGAMLLVERLVRRRELAEAIAVERDHVAEENRRLYVEQRGIADTLQHALLPQALPNIRDTEVSARFVAGVAGVEVGGDWYDVVQVSEEQLLFVVGDVSGSGLRAATVMAELRFAIRAYAADGSPPSQILAKLCRLHSFDTDGHFATVLCGHVDLAAKEMVIANAGHLYPLLSGNPGGFHPVPTAAGLPIGIDSQYSYESARIALPESGTLLAFTDGLVERRGRPIDEALHALQEAASRFEEPLDDLLDRLLAEFGPEGFDDDTAILGVRWLR